MTAAEVLARLSPGEPVKDIARELGIDKKTIKRWRQRGGWRPQAPRIYPKAIDAYRPFLEPRGPEVGWNGVLLLSELRAQGFTGGYQQVQRALQPLRTTRRWAARARVRFETGPGEQAQVDFGQLLVWIGDVVTAVHFFVSRWASPAGPSPTPTATSGSTRCSTATSGRCATSAARRSAASTTIREGHARPVRRPGAVASALRGLRPALRLNYLDVGHAIRPLAIHRASAEATG